jgi:hypothetical protein
MTYPPNSDPNSYINVWFKYQGLALWDDNRGILLIEPFSNGFYLSINPKEF